MTLTPAGPVTWWDESLIGEDSSQNGGELEIEYRERVKCRICNYDVERNTSIDIKKYNTAIIFQLECLLVYLETTGPGWMES